MWLLSWSDNIFAPWERTSVSATRNFRCYGLCAGRCGRFVESLWGPWWEKFYIDVQVQYIACSCYRQSNLTLPGLIFVVSSIPSKKNVSLDLLLDQVHFAPCTASPAAEMPRFAAERLYSKGSWVQRQGTYLRFTSLKARGLGYLWDEEQSSRAIWGVWGVGSMGSVGKGA